MNLQGEPYGEIHYNESIVTIESYTMKFCILGVVKNMMFVVTLVHTPELCFARKEFSTEFKPWLDGMNDLAKKLGITIHGAYSCPNEHTFYFILDSKDLKSITAFFSGIMLTNHTGKVSSVISLNEASAILIK